MGKGKLEDLTGQKFGKLTVMYRTKDQISPSGSHKTVWHCKCECGNECDIRAEKLKSEDTKSCGCFRKEQASKKFIDLTGQKFGKLTALYKTDDRITPSGSHTTMWHCKCDCGNECDVSSNNLIRKMTKSCGCFRKEQTHKERFENLTGQKFGKLIVLYRADDYVQLSGRHRIVWHCKCECGNECNVNAESLKSGNTKSCGCLGKEQTTSFYEQALFFYIKKYFSDAINSYKIKGRMELDIYIPSKNIAIEVDGHFHKIRGYESIDFEKNIYCLNNNIKLIRIRTNGLNNFDNCICIFNKHKSLDEIIIETINLIDNTLKIDINTDRDSTKIYSSYITTEKLYNLEIAYPKIAKEWHPIKNGNLKPNMFLPNTKAKVWWKCSKCGYEWKSEIFSRTMRNTGCPKCSQLKANYKNSKSIICLETKQQFESIILASKITKICEKSISRCCNGKYKTAGGYHWKYAEKED